MMGTIYGMTNEERKLRCPLCNQVTVAERKPDIEANNRKAIQELYSGTYFIRKCENCGKLFLVDDRAIFKKGDDIQIEYWGEAIDYFALREMYKVPERLEYKKVRIVRKREDLVEKIRIFEMGLDDRVIEILKMVKFLMMSEENHSFDADQILCWVTDKKDIELQFYYRGNVIETGLIEHTEYEKFCDLWRELVESIYEDVIDNVFVDLGWGLEFINDYMC